MKIPNCSHLAFLSVSTRPRCRNNSAQAPGNEDNADESTDFRNSNQGARPVICALRRNCLFRRPVSLHRFPATCRPPDSKLTAFLRPDEPLSVSDPRRSCPNRVDLSSKLLPYTHSGLQSTLSLRWSTQLRFQGGFATRSHPSPHPQPQSPQQLPRTLNPQPLPPPVTLKPK